MDGGLVSYFHWWAYHLSDLVLLFIRLHPLCWLGGRIPRTYLAWLRICLLYLVLLLRWIHSNLTSQSCQAIEK